MPNHNDENLTDQQRKWFAAIRDGLQRDTGRSLDDWIAIAKSCPESAPRARLKWFKETHGLLQNRASYVLSMAFPATVGWNQPDELRNRLWADPASRAILAAVDARIVPLPDVIVGQRKAFSAWSRRYQFAALRPVKGGAARLGLALAPDRSARLRPARNEGWSDRLLSSLDLARPDEADDQIAELIKAAWEIS